MTARPSGQAVVNGAQGHRPSGFHPSRKLRVLSLFAGIGGFDLGLERTGGFETVAVAEVNKYSSLILKLRFPDAPNVGDVTEAEYPDADIICAGFPCQDISFAGTGAGLAGSRSGLFWEVVRAIRLVRPRFVLLENVAALLSRGLDDVLRALAEVGYDAEWHCIPASAVGAPHNRDRIWIIANPGGEQYEGGRPPLSGALAEELSRAFAENVADPCDDGYRPDNRPWQDTGETGQAQGALYEREWFWDVAGGGGEALANSNGEWEPQPEGFISDQWGRVGDSGQTLADPQCLGCFKMVESVLGGEDFERSTGAVNDAGFPSGRGWWAVEPDVGRVAHGVPKRVDRLRALGNAVVPQIPELIGRAILASLESEAA